MKKKKCLLFLAGIIVLLLVLTVKNNAEAKKTKLPKGIQLYSSGKKLGSSQTMNIGNTMKIKAKISPAQASQKVNFVSTNKKVAAVSKTGKVEAKKAGKTTIKVTSRKKSSLVKCLKIIVKKKEVTPETPTATITPTTPEPPAATNAPTITESPALTPTPVGRPLISIHDPSVYHDPITGNYYTFGSHLVAAKSTDLINWSMTANSEVGYGDGNNLFVKNYKEEFAEVYSYTMPDGANENAWAPDIIYNKNMKKYCMYISIVDGSQKCCIAMATADAADGPYSYKGMIVCSGINYKKVNNQNVKTDDIEKTNVAEALCITEDEAKSSKYASLSYNCPDAIDATVFYDHDDNLWMVYGSFTTLGGIRLLKLDPETGLRGENYEDNAPDSHNALGTSDPYYGLKIAANYGEGSYIQEVKCDKSPTGYYYYLWYSQGQLQSKGSYNMRLFRAEQVEGPYVDAQGIDATTHTNRQNLGIRVMDDYQFSFMDVAYTSCGGNSATMDDEGRTFIQFHQKYADETERHNIRTHQTFVNEDGWLVTAPLEYEGETIANDYDKTEVAGEYEFIYHRLDYNSTKYDPVQSENITLNADGTITGAYTGTWKLSGHYVTIEIGEDEYKGVVLKQVREGNDVMVFTAVGKNNRSVWGVMK